VLGNASPASALEGSPAPAAADETVDNGLGRGLVECARCHRLFRPYSRRRSAQKYCPGGKCRNAQWAKSHPRIRLDSAAPAATAPKRRRQAVGRRIGAVLQNPDAIASLDRLTLAKGSLKAALEYALRLAG